jgi:WD40 repeat protein
MMYYFWGFILVMLVSFSTHAEDEAPPYLYYYSNTLNAFVVERADGTDSRTLANEIVGVDVHSISTVGWSPSGDWLAWVEGQSILKMMTTDGSRYRTFTDADHYLSAKWSPTEDLLFVAQGPNAHREEVSIRFTLIDVSRDQIITQFERIIKESNSLTNAEWTPDGQFIGFYYQNYNEDPAIRKFESTFVLVSREGVVTEQRFNPTSFHHEIGLGVVRWEANGWIAHYTPAGDQIIVMNPGLEDQFEVNVRLDEAPGFGHGRRLSWSPADNYGLYYGDEYERDSVTLYDLWLLSVADQSMKRIAENVYGMPFRDPFGENYYEAKNRLGSWSPDGRWLAFRQGDDGRIVIMNVFTEEIRNLPIDFPIDGFNVAARWSPDSRYLLLQDIRYREPLTIYDLNSKSISAISDFEINNWIFSPSGHYAAIFNRIGSVFDWSTQARYPLPVHSARVDRVVSYNWHPDEAWLISVDLLCIAGGCPGIFRYGVTDPNGHYWRELEDAEVAWLPPQVDVTKLPKGAPESVLLAPENIDYDVEFMYGSEDRSLYIICVVGDQRAFHILERDTDNLLYQLQDMGLCHGEGEGGAVHVDLSPDGQLLAMAPRYVDTDATLWDVNSGQLLARFNCTCFEMNFSDDGKKLFARASSAMLTWDVTKILESSAVR